MKNHIYSSEPESASFIGKRSEGHISNYYLGEPVSDEEVAAIQAHAEKIDVDILNTRVKKNGPNDFVLLVASADKGESKTSEFTIGSTTAKLTVEYGDCADALSKAVQALTEVGDIIPKLK